MGKTTFTDSTGKNLGVEFDELRDTLLRREFSDRMSKPLQYWVLPSDRRLPIALLGRTVGELLATPFDELSATPGIGQKKIRSLVKLLGRATLDGPPRAETPIDSVRSDSVRSDSVRSDTSRIDLAHDQPTRDADAVGESAGDRPLVARDAIRFDVVHSSEYLPWGGVDRSPAGDRFRGPVHDTRRATEVDISAGTKARYRSPAHANPSSAAAGMPSTSRAGGALSGGSLSGGSLAGDWSFGGSSASGYPFLDVGRASIELAADDLAAEDRSAEERGSEDRGAGHRRVDPADDDRFDPNVVSEALWSEWCNCIRRFPVAHETLGRLSPSLEQLPTVIWNTPLETYLPHTVGEIRSLRTHGEKRVRCVLEVFHAVYHRLKAAADDCDLAQLLTPPWVQRLQAWEQAWLQSDELPTREDINVGFVLPLLEMIEVDCGQTVSRLVRQRLGIGETAKSVREQAKNLGVTRARVYQLLDDCAKIVAVRWPEGQRRVNALSRHLAETDHDHEPLRMFFALRELCFPERLDATHAGASSHIAKQPSSDSAVVPAKVQPSEEQSTLTPATQTPATQTPATETPATETPASGPPAHCCSQREAVVEQSERRDLESEATRVTPSARPQKPR